MFKLLLPGMLLLTACASTGVRYTSLQPSVDKNGEHTFEFLYSKGALADFENNGGEAALLDFYLPRAMAKHDFCKNGYTVEETAYIGVDAYRAVGRCK